MHVAHKGAPGEAGELPHAQGHSAAVALWPCRHWPLPHQSRNEGSRCQAATGSCPSHLSRLLNRPFTLPCPENSLRAEPRGHVPPPFPLPCAAFKLLGMKVTKKEVAALLEEVDKDGSGEVEYPEFLEIMTCTLTKLAQEKEEGEGSAPEPAVPAAASPGPASPDTAVAAAGAEGGGGGGADSVGGGPTGPGTGSVAGLPFDIVATAYRRKKLMEALDEDNKWVFSFLFLFGDMKISSRVTGRVCTCGRQRLALCATTVTCAPTRREFILSMAEAEEAEKAKQAEAAAEVAAAAAHRARRCRASGAQSATARSLAPSSSAEGQASLVSLAPIFSSSSSRALPEDGSSSGGGAGGGPPRLQSHASFLESLSKEERRIIDQLSRKYDSYEDDEGGVQQQHQQRHQQRHQQQRPGGGGSAGPGTGWPPPRSRLAVGASPPAHLAALQPAATVGGSAAGGGGLGQAAGSASLAAGAGGAAGSLLAAKWGSRAATPVGAGGAGTGGEPLLVHYRLRPGRLGRSSTQQQQGAEAQQVEEGLSLLPPSFSRA